jgi:hypothetical protein
MLDPAQVADEVLLQLVEQACLAGPGDDGARHWRRMPFAREKKGASLKVLLRTPVAAAAMPADAHLRARSYFFVHGPVPERR